MTKKLTMALVGFGNSANRYHLPYILTNDNLNLKTIYAHTLGKRPTEQAALEAQGIEFTDSLDAILNDPEIQFVSVITPAPSHFELAKKILESGKNVMVEKPFVTSVAEGKELIKLANEKGLLITPFQNRRFDGEFLELQHVLAHGYIGEPIEFESHFDYFRPGASSNPGEQIDGAFYGYGVHPLDQIIKLWGTPDSVGYDIKSVTNPDGVDDNFDVTLHYANLRAKIKTSFLVAQEYPKYILHGTNGSFIKYGMDAQENDILAGISPADPLFGKDNPDNYGVLKYINAYGDPVEHKLETPIGNYGQMYQNAADVVLDGADKEVTDAQIIAQLEILDAGFQEAGPHVVKFNQ
ncbi:oxidoreductase [Periweissella cryptocerci]|uniref:Oxidoreductase n=1 Tax=Periweissella cryptocerci TaxID=2506420 RepID=A0A4P6YVP2_9LACO|nr:oxidoreductase [Periweissella cryptocerci]QBO36882.1 oxidoreductase [Periweissella cryptocerci]